MFSFTESFPAAGSDELIELDQSLAKIAVIWHDFKSSNALIPLTKRQDEEECTIDLAL